MATGTGIDGTGAQPRKVGALLGIGILLMPYLFAWFLLRRGYSTRARVVAFGWMVGLVIALQMAGRPGSTTDSVSTSGSTAESSDGRTLSQTMTDAVVNPQMNALTDKVARDFVDQYEISRTGGDKIEICVHAGMVAAAYLQAKNQDMYQNWKERERIDCADAGMPKP
jgi:hypothetical protein